MDSIIVLGTSGREGKTESQFAQPRGVCINPITKELFVVDCNNHRIQVFHLPSLSFIRQIGKGTSGREPGCLMYPVGICLGNSNQLYVADTNNHRVAVFNHITGSLVRTIGSQGTGLGCLNCPYGVFVDKNENAVYVADYENHRIQVFDCETGNYIRMYGNGRGDGPGQFQQPIDVCIDEEYDYLLVADYSNNRVQVLNKSTGEFLFAIGDDSGPNRFNGPRALCINQESRLLFISDRENHRIQIYNKTSYTFIRQIGSGMGSARGQFNRPMEMCVDNDEGVLIVVDGYNHRVQIFELPELYKEKVRLKSGKQRKLEILATSIVQPSSLAVKAHLNLQESRIKSIGGNYLVLDSPKYGFSFAFTLSGLDASYFGETAPTLAQTLTFELLDTSFENANNIIDQSLVNSDMLRQQGEVFLGVLGSLSSTPSDESALFVAAPSVVALYLLLVRGWSPKAFPVGIAKLILNLMVHTNISCTGSSETKRLLVACAVLLKNVVENQPEQRAELIPYILDAINVFTANPIDIFEFLGVKEAEVSTGEVVKPIMYLFYVLYSCLHVLEQGHTRTDSSLSSGINSEERMDASKIDLKRSHTLRDKLFVIYGFDSSTLLSKKLRRTGGPSDTHLLYISQYFVPTIQALLTFIRLDEPTRDSQHESGEKEGPSVESIITARVSFLLTATNYLRDVHETNSINKRKKEIRTRGGRNIWDGTSPMQVGDLIDCMDREKSWFESIVIDPDTPDGIRVHFMGWGSKWDDTIPPSDISLRIAPLNTYTKDWRHDLFEGGLIEIKCNDDLVNQKWMWGKITKLDLENEWLEVAYSFSNEPAVVKKAWIWGETICPVGMHTKDKSRAAASSVSKPEKSVEEMIREKVIDSLPDKELCIFDPEDDYNEQSDQALPTAPRQNDEGHKSVSNSSESNDELSISLGAATIFIAEIFFQRICREIVLAISDMTNPVTMHLDLTRKQTVVVTNLLCCLSSLPCTSLLYENILKPLYFQTGGRARLIAYSSLKNSNSDNHLNNSIEARITQLIIISESLIQLEQRYVSIITEIMSTAFASPTIRYINEKIRSTILYCGFTHVANDIISTFAADPSLLSKAFFPLLSSQRYHRKNISLRKLLRSLVAAASVKQVEKLLTLIERTIIKNQVEGFTSLSYFQQFYLQNDDRLSSSMITKKRPLKSTLSLEIDIFKFLDDFIEQIIQTKAIISPEILRNNRIIFSVERMLNERGNRLDANCIEILGAILSQTIFSLLLDGGKTSNQSLSLLGMDSDYATITKYVEKGLFLLTTLINEEMYYLIFLSFSQDYWWKYLISRLRGNFSTNRSSTRPNLEYGLSTTITGSSRYSFRSHLAPPVISRDLLRTTLSVLPYGKKILSTIDTLEYSDQLTEMFLLHILHKSDQVIDNKSKFIHYLGQNEGGFTITCLNTSQAPQLLKSQYFRNLTLPALLLEGQLEFMEFYESLCEPISMLQHPKKLLWCQGYGILTVDCILNNRRCVTMTISEAQCTILELIRIEGNRGISLIELAVRSGLSVEITTITLQSLMENVSVPLVSRKQITKASPLKQRQSEIHRVDEEDIHSEYYLNEKEINSLVMQMHSIHSRELVVDYTEHFFARIQLYSERKNVGGSIKSSSGIISDQEWETNLIDAAILRILKVASRQPTNAFLKFHNLVLQSKSYLLNSLPTVTETAITQRVLILIEKELIFRHTTVAAADGEEGEFISYFPVETDATTPVPASSSSVLRTPDRYSKSPGTESSLPSVITFDSFTKRFFVEIHSAEELSKLFQQILFCHPDVGESLISNGEAMTFNSHFFFEYVIKLMGTMAEQMNYLISGYLLDSFSSQQHPKPCVDVWLAILHQLLMKPSKELLSKIQWFHYSTLALDWRYEIYALYRRMTTGWTLHLEKESFLTNPVVSMEMVASIWEVSVSLIDFSKLQNRYSFRERRDFHGFEDNSLSGFQKYLLNIVTSRKVNINSSSSAEHVRDSTETISGRSMSDSDLNIESEEKYSPSASLHTSPFSKPSVITFRLFYEIFIDYLSVDLEIPFIFAKKSWAASPTRMRAPSGGEGRHRYEAREDQNYQNTVSNSPSRSLAVRSLSMGNEVLQSIESTSTNNVSDTFPPSASQINWMNSQDPHEHARRIDLITHMKSMVKDFKDRMNSNQPSSKSTATTTAPLLSPDVLTEERRAPQCSLTAASPLHLQSSNEYKSGNSFLSPPLSPYSRSTISSSEVMRGMTSFYSSTSGISFSKEVNPSLHSCFLLPAFRCLELKLKDFFSNITDGYYSTTYYDSIASNEQVMMYLAHSINQVLADLPHLVTGQLARLWWYPAEIENLQQLLRSGFMLMQKCQSCVPRTPRTSSNSDLEVEKFRELLFDSEDKKVFQSDYSRTIITLLQLTSFSWNQACEEYRQHLYDVTSCLENYYSSNEHVTFRPTFILGSEFTCDALKEGQWNCFQCLKPVSPDDMIALATCNHFACKGCWKKSLLQQLEFFAEQLSCEDNNSSDEANSILDLLQYFQCPRNESDPRCTCTCYATIDLIIYLFQEDLSRFSSLLRQIYYYYSTEYDRFFERKQYIERSEESLVEYVQFCGGKDRFHPVVGPEGKPSNTCPCCSLCIDYNLKCVAANLDAPGDLMSQTNPRQSLRCFPRPNTPPSTQSSTSLKHIVNADDFRISLIWRHSRSHSKIVQYLMNINSFDRELECCQNRTTYTMLSHQQQFWKLLLSCVFLNDHLYHEMKQGKEEVASAHSDGRDCEELEPLDLSASKLISGEKVFLTHQEQLLKMIDQFEGHYDRFLHSFPNISEIGKRHFLASLAEAPKAYNITLQPATARILGNNTQYYHYPLTTELLNSVNLPEFQGLYQLLENVRAYHLVLYQRYIRAIQVRDQKQLYQTTKALRDPSLDRACPLTEQSNSRNASKPIFRDLPQHVRFLLTTTDIDANRRNNPNIPSSLPSLVSGLRSDPLEESSPRPTAELEFEKQYKDHLIALEELLSSISSSTKQLTHEKESEERSLVQKLQSFSFEWDSFSQSLIDHKPSLSFLESITTTFSQSFSIQKMQEMLQQFLIVTRYIATGLFQSKTAALLREMMIELLTELLPILTIYFRVLVYYYRHNLQSFFEIFTIDMTITEDRERSEAKTSSTPESGSDINLFTLLTDLSNIIEEISTTSAGVVPFTFPITCMSRFQRVLEVMIEWIGLVDEKREDDQEDVNHSSNLNLVTGRDFMRDDDIEVKNNDSPTELSILVSPSLSATLLGSLPMSQELYRQLLKMQSKVFHQLQDLALSMRQSPFATTSDWDRQQSISSFYGIFALNTVKLFYQNTKTFTTLTTTGGAGSITDLTNTINHKKDLLLMDIMEFGWKEIMSWGSRSRQCEDRMAEQRELAERSLQAKLLEEDSEEEEDEDNNNDDDKPTDDQKEEEKNTTRTDKFSLPKASEEKLERTNMNQELFLNRLQLERYKGIYLQLLYQMIQVIKQRAIDQRYESIQQSMTSLAKSSNSNSTPLSASASYSNTRLMQEEDRTQTERSQTITANTRSAAAPTTGTSHSISITENNYFLVISVMQRMLSNNHELIYLLLDALFTIDLPQTTSRDRVIKTPVTIPSTAEFSGGLTSAALSELMVEIFTNHYFVFLLRSIMNPNHQVLASSLKMIRTEILSHYYNYRHHSERVHDPEEPKELLEDSTLSVFTTHQDEILEILYYFFQHYSNFLLQEERIRRIPSTTTSLNYAHSLTSDIVNSNDRDVIREVSMRSSLIPNKDANEKVLLQYLPPAGSTLTMMNQSYPIIYEYTIAEVLSTCQQMLWSLNIVHSFWVFYFEYFYSSVKVTSSATTVASKLSIPMGRSLFGNKATFWIHRFHQLLQQRNLHLTALSIHEYHEYSTTYYTKSFYHNSIVLLQRLLDLFYEKLISDSSSSPSSSSLLAPNSKPAVATTTDNKATKASSVPTLPPLPSLAKTSYLDTSKRGAESRQRHSFSLVYPATNEDLRHHQPHDMIEGEDVEETLGGNEEENIFNLRLLDGSLGRSLRSWVSRSHHPRFIDRFERDGVEEEEAEEESDDEEEEEDQEEDSYSDTGAVHGGRPLPHDDDDDDDDSDYHRRQFLADERIVHHLMERDANTMHLLRFLYLTQQEPGMIHRGVILESDDDSLDSNQEDHQDLEEEDSDNEEDNDNEEEEEEEDNNDNVDQEIELRVRDEEDHQNEANNLN